MNKGLRILIGVLAALITLFLWSCLLVLVKWDGIFLKYLGAAIAVGAGKTVYELLKKKGKQNDNEPPREQ